MNYDYFTNYTYENILTDIANDTAYLFGYNGNVIQSTSLDMSQSFEFNLNAFASDFNSVVGDEISFVLLAHNSTTYLISTTRNDFITFKSVGGQFAGSTYSSNLDILSASLTDYLGDMDTGVNGGYYIGNANGSVVSTNPYSQWTTSIIANNRTCVIDFTNLKYNIYNDEYVQERQTALCRGDMQTYYTFVLNVHASSSVNIGIGSPIYDTYQQGFNNGYANGYLNGRTDYSGGGIDNATLDAFDYIGAGFNAVTNILSLEVLPHVTLGLVFSIPLTFVIIATLFKLIKR